MEKDRYGFEFTYHNRRVVGMSRRLTEEEMDEIDKSKRSEISAMYVRCGKCGEYMDFVDDRWICRKCRVYMREQKAWKQINREIAMCDEILNNLEE